MNTAAEEHLAKAKDYLAKGDEFYRKAKPEIEAAIAAGASQREVGRILLRDPRWVRDVLAWDGKGTLYAKDTERRQLDQAKQVLREAPLEQVEQIVGALTPERQQAVAAAAGNAYHKARQDYAENEARMTTAERKEREAAGEAITRPVRDAVGGFVALGIAGHLEQATDELRELIADSSVSEAVLARIEEAHSAFATELEVARGMAGLEVQS